MAAMDFPASPAVGDRYPTSAVAGQTQYVWDGEKWATAGSAGIDQAAADARYVNVAGDTMSGDLHVGAGTGVSRLHIDGGNATGQGGLLEFDRGGGLTWLAGNASSLLGTASSDLIFWNPTAGPVLSLNATSGVVDFPTKKPTVAGQVWAAPLDALAYNGMQINGSMEVNQETGPALIPNAGDRVPVDTWRVTYSHPTAAFTVTQAGTGNTPIANGVFFQNFIVLTATTAMASIAAADYAHLLHYIEGYRAARLGFGTAAAQPLTIGFWVYCTAGGVASVSIHNRTHDRSYVTPVSVTAATWQYKTITVPGCTDGVWERTNQHGLGLFFNFACGTNFSGAANTWVNGNLLTAPGATNFFAAANSAVYITGVVVLPGIEAPSATRSPLIMRPYDQELLTCQRYWRPIVAASGAAYSATNIGILVEHRGMRATPTASVPGVVTCTDIYSTNPVQTTAAVAISVNGPDRGNYYFANFTGLVSGRTYWMHASSNPVYLDARL